MRRRYWEEPTTYISQIDGKWYAFGGDTESGQVFSIGADNPNEGDGHWFGCWTDSHIKYVASPSPTRHAAYQKARRHGVYSGEV